jgi:hypothetical protein
MGEEKFQIGEDPIVKLRSMALMGLVAAIILAFARTGVAGGGVKCMQPRPPMDPGMEQKTGHDGSFCMAQSDGGPAVAKAAGSTSRANASADVRGSATSNAKSAGVAAADGEDAGTAIATAKTHGTATADALGEHPGMATGADQTKAVAKASAFGDSFAHAEHQGSALAKSILGQSTATDTGGGFPEADSFNGGDAVAITSALCFATSGASDTDSETDAECFVELGISQAFASKGGVATAVSDEACTSRAVAKGRSRDGNTRSTASATCNVASSKVTAEAHGGGKAIGSDIDPPICDTSAGGTAKVRSPGIGGNCG